VEQKDINMFLGNKNILFQNYLKLILLAVIYCEYSKSFFNRNALNNHTRFQSKTN